MSNFTEKQKIICLVEQNESETVQKRFQDWRQNGFQTEACFFAVYWRVSLQDVKNVCFISVDSSVQVSF